MQPTLEIYALADAMEKSAAGFKDSLNMMLGQMPIGGAGLLGAIAGGGLGALIPSRDEEGETHRLRNALLGALAGGAIGGGLGGMNSSKLQAKGIMSALETGNQNVAGNIVRDVLRNKLTDAQKQAIQRTVNEGALYR